MVYDMQYTVYHILQNICLLKGYHGILSGLSGDPVTHVFKFLLIFKYGNPT